MTLDQEIVDTFSVVSLLLAVAAAYLAAIWPVIAELLQPVKPKDNYATQQLATRRRSYAVSAAFLTALMLVIAFIMLPLVVGVASQWDWGGDFHPIRAGLVVAFFAMIGGAVVTGVLSRRLFSKAGP